ncbi:MAG: LamG domain-containing protein [Phycisphaerales bacterium]|nr:LamG domain-containing protein [Phycisphaerales bacterium]
MRPTWTGVVAALLLAHAANAQPNNGGGFIHLDGVDDSVMARGDFVTQTLTIEAWLRPESLHPQWTAGIVTYGGASSSSFDFGVGPTDDRRLRFFINWNQGQKTIIGAQALTMNEWQHVAVTYDGAVARLYINGVLDAEKAFDTAILPSGADAMLAIGDDFPGASEFLGGQIDEVRIWSVARPQADIQATMAEPLTGWEPGLLAYYNFDEVAGQLVLDKSRTGHHANLGFNLDPELRDAARERYAPTRLRAMRVSSSGDVEVRPISGTIGEQLAAINAGPPPAGWDAVENRHEDLHERDAFPCGNNLDRPYVDSTLFLVGADEVTLDNCASAFYRASFEMPPAFRHAAVLGAANGDDLAVAFINQRPISLLLTQNDVDNLGADRVVTRHPLLGWPTADPVFEDEVPDLVSPGHNQIAFGVCSDASEFEPAGLEFDMLVQYECLADWNIDGANDTSDFITFLNDWNARDPETDLNGDGAVNTQDVLLFINVWTFGCPE